MTKNHPVVSYKGVLTSLEENKKPIISQPAKFLMEGC